MAGEKLISKALQAVRKSDPLGFYSKAAEEAQRLPQAKGTGEQMRAMLLKQGAKPEELKWTGFDDWAKGKKSVTRDEVADYLEKNRVQVGEKVLGGVSPIEKRTVELEALGSRRTSQEDNELVRIYAGDFPKQTAPTKFQQYSLPGGENYREVLLTLPAEKKQLIEYPVIQPDGRTLGRYASKEKADAAAGRIGGTVGEPVSTDVESGYRSSHWRGDLNPVAHLRMADRTDPEGRKILHLEELQSDWAQEGRKKGFSDPAAYARWLEQDNATRDALRVAQRAHEDLVSSRFPREDMRFRPGQETPREFENRVNAYELQRQQAMGSEPEFQESAARMRAATDARSAVGAAPSTTGLPSAPFVGSTPGWTDLALKRALREAAEGNYDAMAWTPGATQAARYPGGTPEEEAKRLKGMIGYYDKVLPTQLQKMTRDLDPNARFGTTSIQTQDTPRSMAHFLDWAAARGDTRPRSTLGQVWQRGENEPFVQDFMKETSGRELPSLTITPEMREKIKQGLPLFTAPSVAAAGVAASAMPQQEDQGFRRGGSVDQALRLLQDEYPTQYMPNVGRQVMQAGGTTGEPMTLEDILALIRSGGAELKEFDPRIPQINASRAFGLQGSKFPNQAMPIIPTVPYTPDETSPRPLTVRGERSAPTSAPAPTQFPSFGPIPPPRPRSFDAAPSAPAPSAPAPSADDSVSRALWAAYNESESPADFLRADAAMREGRADAAMREGRAGGGKAIAQALAAIRKGSPRLPSTPSLDEFMPERGPVRLPSTPSLDEFMPARPPAKLPSTPSLDEFMPERGPTRLPSTPSLDEFMPEQGPANLPSTPSLDEFMPEGRYAGGGKVLAEALAAIRNGTKVFPKPQRMFPEGARPPGGEYLNAATGEVITGQKPARAVIGVTPEGKPVFLTDTEQVDVTGSPGPGSTKTKTNLFKQQAGWKWAEAPKGYENVPTIVSAENRGKHYYGLGADFPKGVDLERYADAPSEPRLRPTTQGNVYPGERVGAINVRGREHPVYDMLTIRNILAGTGAGAAGAASMGDSEEGYAGGGKTVSKALKAVSDLFDSPGMTQWREGSKIPASSVEDRYFTGTSKDKDFANFNVGRHGAWFTKDPADASMYARENDSKGYRREGWGMVPVNTADRVIPAFLRSENPFTGPLPDMARAENYKKAQSDWFDQLRAQGHDAWMPETDPNLAVILRDPSNIKSAISNTGEFDRASPRVDRAEGGEVGGDDYQSPRSRVRAALDLVQNQMAPQVADGEGFQRALQNYRNFPQQQGEATARPLQPDARDVLGGAIAGDPQRGETSYMSEMRRRAADALVGSKGLPGSGTLGFGLADLPMATGLPLMASDIAGSAGRGDYAEAALGAALPAAFYARQPIGKALGVARDALGRVPAPVAAGAAGAAAMSPDEAEASPASAIAKRMMRGFHGSPYEFNSFDPSKSVTAKHIYATPFEDDAKAYGRHLYELSLHGKLGRFLPDQRGVEETKALKKTYKSDDLEDYFTSFGDFVDAFDSGQMYQRFASQRPQNTVMQGLFNQGYNVLHVPDAGFGGRMSESYVLNDPRFIEIINRNGFPIKKANGGSAETAPANEPGIVDHAEGGEVGGDEDIRQYERVMAEIAEQPEDIRFMTHAPSVPMRPVEIEGGLVGKRQLGSAPYNVAGPLSTSAQLAYDMKSLPFYFTPAAPFAAASDTAEMAINMAKSIKKGDYLGAGIEGVLGVAPGAIAFRKPIANAGRQAVDYARSLGRQYADGGSVEQEQPGLVDRAMSFLSQFNPVGSAEASPASAIAKRIMGAASPEDRLMLVHNLKSHRLGDVEKLGGLPVPSTAIIKPEQGFKSFGDVTMVAPKEMAKPSATNPIFGADVYSPRFPSLNDEGNKIFKGFSPSGSRRYVPLNLENAVKEMKGNIRGGEGFNYGAGTIRAGITPQFKSIEEIQAARGQIMPRKNMQSAFDEANERLNTLSEKYYPHYGYGGDQWTHQKDLSDMLRLAGQGKWSELQSSYKPSLPSELRGETKEFLEYLKNLPTEYFEGKPQRAVRLNEFRGAVVPGDIAGDQADILRRMGVERLEEYDPNDPASRIRALRKFENEQFKRGGSVSHRALMLASSNT